MKERKGKFSTFNPSQGQKNAAAADVSLHKQIADLSNIGDVELNILDEKAPDVKDIIREWYSELSDVYIILVDDKYDLSDADGVVETINAIPHVKAMFDTFGVICLANTNETCFARRRDS